MLRQVAIILAVTLAVVSVQAQQEIPKEYENCEGCWVPQTRQFIQVGEVVPDPTECFGYRCTSSGLVAEYCGTVRAVAPCKVVQDLSLSYPACCASIDCSSGQQ